MHRFVEVAPGVALWSEWVGPADDEPVLLLAGANAAGLSWPDELVDQLAEYHAVLRYDHRDTGRSTWAFDDEPYTLADLAGDAVAVLDAWEVPRAHVVGMSMGGTLAQLLLLDHPHRLHTATLLCCSVLGAGGPDDGPEELPGPSQGLQRMWQEFDDPRDDAGELSWRVEHWRLLHGGDLPFDAAEFRRLEQRILAHTGHPRSPSAHSRVDASGLERRPELAAVTVPTLVVEAPADPVNPPPHAALLAASIGGSRWVSIPGMGHAIAAAVVPALADAILGHTAASDRPRV